MGIQTFSPQCVYFQTMFIYLTAYLTSPCGFLVSSCVSTSLSLCAPRPPKPHEISCDRGCQVCLCSRTFLSLPGLLFLYFRSLFKYAIIRKLFLSTLYKIWVLHSACFIFLQSTFPHLTYIIFCLLSLFPTSSWEWELWPFCSLLWCVHFEECLVHNRCSVNIC